MQNDLDGHLSNDYNGSISITQSGHNCRSWSKTPYASTIGDNHNHCRSPDNDLLGAWCYTTNKMIRWDQPVDGVKWDYCALPIILNGNYTNQSYLCSKNYIHLNLI